MITFVHLNFISMNKLFTKLQVVTLLSVMATFTVTSCVNEEYDLSQGVDMDMQLLQNATVPIGDTGSIGINTLLGDTQSGSSFFNVSESGDLSLSFGSEKLTQTFSVPEVNLSGDGGIKMDSFEISFNIPEKYTEIPANLISRVLAQEGIRVIYCSQYSRPLQKGENGIDQEVPFELDKLLPENILSIRQIDMDGRLELSFYTSEGSYLHIEEGYVIDFPEFMRLKSNKKDADYEIQNGHTVVFTDDILFSYENPLIIDLSFTSLTGLDNMIHKNVNETTGSVERYITVDSQIKSYGNVYIKPADYGKGYIPSNPMLAMNIESENLSMTSAELMLDMDLEIADKMLEIGQLPDMFTGNGTVVDLYNPVLRFQIDNGSPLQISMNAEITSQCPDHRTDIHIGDHCKNGNKETAPIVIPSEGSVEYYFSRQGFHNNDHGLDVPLEKLGEIITMMPEQLSIHDIVVAAEKKYITVNTNEEYAVSLDFGFDSDLSFGKDLHISFDYDFDLGLSTSTFGMESLVLSMNLVNTIPLDLNLQGIALDERGNEISSASLNIKMNAGTLDNPVTTPSEIRLNASNSELNISKLRLKIVASSNEQMQGNVLNMNQGLSINDLVVTLPDGIKIDLANNSLE